MKGKRREHHSSNTCKNKRLCVEMRWKLTLFHWESSGTKNVTSTWAGGAL